jgi:hypothetical protein
MTRNTPKIPRTQSASTYALILTLLLSLTGVAIAADVEREQRLVTELEASLFDGDLQRLSAGKVTFTAVELRPDSTPVRGSIILLHGRGVHADWPDNIGPLRMALAQNGWHTLSLQMPVLEKSAKYFDYLAILPEAFPRIEAGIKHLLTSGHRPIVLLAHSCGAHMAMAWLEATAGRHIDAFIGIGMGATDYRQPMQRPFPFATLKIPVLDIFGSEDYPAVHRLAPIRLEKIQLGGHRGSTQVVVDGADHDFTAYTSAMAQPISRWLNSLTF